VIRCGSRVPYRIRQRRSIAKRFRPSAASPVLREPTILVRCDARDTRHVAFALVGQPLQNLFDIGFRGRTKFLPADLISLLRGRSRHATKTENHRRRG
jgi:hypothetical protein